MRPVLLTRSALCYLSSPEYLFSMLLFALDALFVFAFLALEIFELEVFELEVLESVVLFVLLLQLLQSLEP
jgi:hypothetical protein